MSDKNIEKSPQHSPVPWKTVTGTGALEGKLIVVDANGKNTTAWLEPELAKFIVRAVNSHEVAEKAMAEILKIFDDDFSVDGMPHPKDWEAIALLARKFQEIDRE